MIPDRKPTYQASTLTELLGHRASHQPEQLAFTFLAASSESAATFTYRQLDLQARAISASLDDVVASGDRVLMLYPPGLAYISAFFGCLYAGAVAVPSYPPDPARLSRTLPRLEAIVEDARPRVVLTTTSLLSQLTPHFDQSPAYKGLSWIATDRLESGEYLVGVGRTADPDSLVLLQYTSGSTGTPRGVMLSHRNLMSNAAMVYSGVEHESTDSYVSWLPVSHDMGFMAGILQPLYGGLSVVLMSPLSFLQNPLSWLEAITRYRATTSGGPNFAYDLCVRKITAQQRATLDLSCWRVAFNGSEPIRQATLDNFAKTFEECGFRREAFYPCYGLAEATLIVSGGARNAAPIVNQIDAGEMEKNRVKVAPFQGQAVRSLVGCGKSLLDQNVVIANPESLRLCEADRIGEIWVSGHSVARGYWNRPDETDVTFNARLLDTSEGPFLRTGDLGFLRDGELFVTGRLKDLIIIRGLNYYPQDIELTVERSHRSLRPGCVAAFSMDDSGEERLAIVAEVEQRKAADLDEVIHAIRRSVAENHDLRTNTIALIKSGTIPKTSSGKIQRRACKAGLLKSSLDELTRNTLNESQPSSGRQSFVLNALLAIDPEKRLTVALSYLQERVVQVVGSGLRSLPMQQPLSSLGLDSLMVTELKTRIGEELDIDLPISLLYESDFEQLARELINRLGPPTRTEAIPQLESEEAPKVFPLSYVQKALWFFYQLAPDAGAYNVALATRIPSGIDVAALRLSLQSIIDRHPALRTTYSIRIDDGEPVQSIRPLEVCFKHVLASGWSRDHFNGVLLDEAYSPLDLENGPVFRAVLFTLSPAEQVMLLVVHHLAIDGWSLWLLLDELRAIYASHLDGTQAELPPLKFQYGDFVRWQQELAAGPEGERLLEYWKTELAGELPVLDLPTFRPRPAAQTFKGGSYDFQLNEDLTLRLNAMANREGATLYMALLAAFQVLLYRYTNQEDIIIGSPMSARTRKEFQNIVGCFFNAVPLRARLSGNLTFIEFLSQVRQTVLRALEHQDYPSQLLAEKLQPVRVQNRSSLFQVSLNLQKPRSLQESLLLGDSKSSELTHTRGLAFELLPLEKRFARSELELELIDAGRKVLGSLQYNADIFDIDTIARAACHYQRLLEAIVSNPKERISRMSILTDAEREQLLFEWSNVGTRVSNGMCAHELFEQQAQRTPDKAAAVYGGSSLIYNELNEQASRLARLIERIKDD